MKALSIRQPWAWLIVNGHKPVENRSWSTKYRGPLLIHASRTIDVDGLAWAKQRGFDLPDEFQTGGIIGEVTLEDCVEDFDDPRWFTGPFGFVLSNPTPIPFRPFAGQLGLFEVPGFEIPFAIQCFNYAKRTTELVDQLSAITGRDQLIIVREAMETCALQPDSLNDILARALAAAKK